MRKPTAVIDLDVTQPLTFAAGLDRYVDAAVLCRLRERPLGLVRAPVDGGRLVLEDAVRELLEKLTRELGVALAERAIASGRPLRWPDTGILVEPSPRAVHARPLVTVAICTSGRAPSLRACLDSLMALEYRPIDVLVVDYGGNGAATERLVSEYAGARYVREPNPGLDPARRRAILECQGDILAFTDADAEVDRHWISAIVRTFLADPEVMAVRGLVIPRELGADGRRLLEEFIGFAGGFRRRWSRTQIDGSAVGHSSNVAFWRSALESWGRPEGRLLPGRPSQDGPRRELHTAVYEPSAIVRAPRVRCRELRPQVGSARRAPAVARRVDLADLVKPIADAIGHDQLRVMVSWEGAPLGEVEIEHRGAVVSTAWLMDVIAQELTVPVLDARTRLGEHVLWSTITSTLAGALLPAIETSRKDRRQQVSEAA